jgi:hypothetical protein
MTPNPGEPCMMTAEERREWYGCASVEIEAYAKKNKLSFRDASTSFCRKGRHDHDREPERRSGDCR